ncbi:MAG: ABC transporter substrate-binding protein [Alphaproteobacteria bacterium]|nr:ABC transporter substrate-binding protein [Alphaproteobacteria bacterium]
MRPRTVLAAVLILTAMPAIAPKQAGALELKETPYFGHSVGSGALPPVARRVPETPRIYNPDGKRYTLGRHGGTLRILMARPRDTRLMVVYGYGRLVKYDEKYELIPDLLERYTVEDGRIFTFHLRKGHRWSDGHPFTTEDFRYYWEDVANNKKLSLLGPPQTLLVDGEKPTVEIIDTHTIRYSWSKPNPFFLPALANATALFIYRPAHYLKQFHARYVEPKALRALAKKITRRSNWASLHHNRDRMYKFDNPELPTLQPWVLRTKPPAERFIFRRNPYYHRVDTNGRQLPYIDRVIMVLAAPKIIPVKTGAGETDLQARYLPSDKYAFLAQGAARHGFKVHMWRTAAGSHIAFYPNLNVADKMWRQIIRDVRFRRALSLAINRHEINEVLYFGFAIEGANAVLPASPLFKKTYQSAWARYDIAAANKLLDEMGFTKRNSQGYRLLPDGREMEILVEITGEGGEHGDVLSLVEDTWRKIGIRMFRKIYRREVLRRRVFSGETMMSMWSGLENGLPTPMMSPEELAPTRQIHLQWPKWGQYRETGGKVGDKIDMPLPIKLYELNHKWELAKSAEERRRIWHQMLAIFTDQVYTIGTVAGVEQPVVVAPRLRNVPTKGVYNWDPGAHFGIYEPDRFWFGPDPAKSKQSKRNSSSTASN